MWNLSLAKTVPRIKSNVSYVRKKENDQAVENRKTKPIPKRYSSASTRDAKSTTILIALIHGANHLHSKTNIISVVQFIAALSKAAKFQIGIRDLKNVSDAQQPTIANASKILRIFYI